jgi:hypothetical protein
MNRTLKHVKIFLERGKEMRENDNGDESNQCAL